MDNKMEVARMAMEEGARVSFNFHGIKSRKDAELKANEYADKLSCDVQEDKSRGVNWFCLNGKGFHINVFFEESEEESA